MGIFYNKTTFKVHRDAQEIPVKAKVDVLVCVYFVNSFATSF